MEGCKYPMELMVEAPALNGSAIQDFSNGLRAASCLSDQTAFHKLGMEMLRSKVTTWASDRDPQIKF